MFPSCADIARQPLVYRLLAESVKRTSCGTISCGFCALSFLHSIHQLKLPRAHLVFSVVFAGTYPTKSVVNTSVDTNSQLDELHVVPALGISLGRSKTLSRNLHRLGETPLQQKQHN